MTPAFPRYRGRFAPSRGRFAPSPTGPLHFGSLVAALASYLDVRQQHGQWLVRIEDLDPPRELAGAADQILRTLEGFGFAWDGEIEYQSRHLDRYREVMEWLLREGKAFPCACSRREIARNAHPGVDGPVYPGTCRAGPRAGKPARSVRIRTDNHHIILNDRIQGRLTQSLQREVGDYLIRRGDGLFAYQLAVVVDDAAQGITHVVRGADLLSSTPRQIHLQQQLNLPTPIYAHLPLVVDRSGRKLSKQAGSRPVRCRQALNELCAAYTLLGQELPPQRPGDLEEFWDWALSHWKLERVPPVTTLPSPSSEV